MQDSLEKWLISRFEPKIYSMSLECLKVPEHKGKKKSNKNTTMGIHVKGI